jgi:hypothetical protein
MHTRLCIILQERCELCTLYEHRGASLESFRNMTGTRAGLSYSTLLKCDAFVKTELQSPCAAFRAGGNNEEQGGWGGCVINSE